MEGVLAQAWAVLFDPKLLTTWLSLQRIVVVAGFLTDEEDRFGFLLALGHAGARKMGIRIRLVCFGGAIIAVTRLFRQVEIGKQAPAEGFCASRAWFCDPCGSESKRDYRRRVSPRLVRNAAKLPTSALEGRTTYDRASQQITAALANPLATTAGVRKAPGWRRSLRHLRLHSPDTGRNSGFPAHSSNRGARRRRQPRDQPRPSREGEDLSVGRAPPPLRGSPDGDRPDVKPIGWGQYRMIGGDRLQWGLRQDHRDLAAKCVGKGRIATDGRAPE